MCCCDVYRVLANAIVVYLCEMIIPFLLGLSGRADDRFVETSDTSIIYKESTAC